VPKSNKMLGLQFALTNREPLIPEFMFGSASVSFSFVEARIIISLVRFPRTLRFCFGSMPYHQLRLRRTPSSLDYECSSLRVSMPYGLSLSKSKPVTLLVPRTEYQYCTSTSIPYSYTDRTCTVQKAYDEGRGMHVQSPEGILRSTGKRLRLGEYGVHCNTILPKLFQ
jgi:hypothetical protein